MSHFTHTFELLASLWQFPSFPQINEKSSCFQLFGTEQRVIKREERGDLSPMFTAVRDLQHIGKKNYKSDCSKIREGGKKRRKLALYQISKDALFGWYQIQRGWEADLWLIGDEVISALLIRSWGSIRERWAALPHREHIWASQRCSAVRTQVAVDEAVVNVGSPQTVLAEGPFGLSADYKSLTVSLDKQCSDYLDDHKHYHDMDHKPKCRI